MNTYLRFNQGQKPYDFKKDYWPICVINYPHCLQKSADGSQRLTIYICFLRCHFCQSPESLILLVVEGIIISIYVLQWQGSCLFCPSVTQLSVTRVTGTTPIFSPGALCRMVLWRQHGLLASCGGRDRETRADEM